MEIGSQREGSFEAGVDNLVKLQDELSQSGQTVLYDHSHQEYLEVLARRLNRIRSWGGSYGEIEFSPEIKAAIGQDCREQANSRNRAKALV